MVLPCLSDLWSPVPDLLVVKQANYQAPQSAMLCFGKIPCRTLKHFSKTSPPAST